MTLYAHGVHCAAYGSSGCTSYLIINTDSPKMGSVDEELLKAEGWRLDQGKWVCGNEHVKGGTAS